MQSAPLNPAAEGGSPATKRSSWWATAYFTVATTARTLAAATFASVLAGLLAAGVGARIAMYIVGRLAPEGVRFANSGGMVGKVTISGTIEVLVIGTIVAVPAGLFFLVLRPWLQRWAKRESIAYGLVTIIFFGSVAIEHNNFDFWIFGPPLPIIAGFLALAFLFGFLVPPFYRFFNFLLPHPRRIVTALLLPLYALSLFVCQAAMHPELENRPMTSVPAVLLGIFVVLLDWKYKSRAWMDDRRLRLAGLGLFGAAMGSALFTLVSSIVIILQERAKHLAGG